MSLGRDFIIPASLLVNGGRVPANLTVNYRAGTVEWTNTVGDEAQVYVFEFDYQDFSDEVESEANILSLVRARANVIAAQALESEGKVPVGTTNRLQLIEDQIYSEL